MTPLQGILGKMMDVWLIFFDYRPLAACTDSMLCKLDLHNSGLRIQAILPLALDITPAALHTAILSRPLVQCGDLACSDSGVL